MPGSTPVWMAVVVAVAAVPGAAAQKTAVGVSCKYDDLTMPAGVQPTAASAAQCAPGLVIKPGDPACSFHDPDPARAKVTCEDMACDGKPGGWANLRVKCNIPGCATTALDLPPNAETTNVSFCGGVKVSPDRVLCEFTVPSDPTLVCTATTCNLGDWTNPVTCTTDECCDGCPGKRACDAATPAQTCRDDDQTAVGNFVCECKPPSIRDPAAPAVVGGANKCKVAKCRVDALKTFCNPYDPLDCAVPTAGKGTECDLDVTGVEVAMGTVCSYMLNGTFSCNTVTCVGDDEWEVDALSCVENPCEIDALGLPGSAEPVDAGLCSPGMAVEGKAVCEFEIPDYKCAPVRCVMSQWVPDDLDTVIVNPRNLLDGLKSINCGMWRDECCVGCPSEGVCVPEEEQVCHDENFNIEGDWVCRCREPEYFPGLGEKVPAVCQKFGVTDIPPPYLFTNVPVPPSVGCAYDDLTRSSNPALNESFLNCRPNGVVPFQSPAGDIYPCYYLDTAADPFDPQCLRALCVENATSYTALANDWALERCANTAPTVVCLGEREVSYPQPSCEVMGWSEDDTTSPLATTQNVTITKDRGVFAAPSSPVGYEEEQKVTATCTCSLGCHALAIDTARGQIAATFPPNFNGVFRFTCRFFDDGFPRLWRDRAFVGEVAAVNDYPTLLMLASRLSIDIFGAVTNATGREYVVSAVRPGPASAIDERTQGLVPACGADARVFAETPQLVLEDLGGADGARRGELQYAVLGDAPQGKYAVRCRVTDEEGLAVELGAVTVTVNRVSLDPPNATDVGSLTSKTVNSGGGSRLRFRLTGATFRGTDGALAVQVVGPDDPLPVDDPGSPFITVRSKVDPHVHRWGLVGMTRREGARFVQARLSEGNSVMDLYFAHGHYIALEEEAFDVVLNNYALGVSDYDAFCANNNCTLSYVIAPQLDEPISSSVLDHVHLALEIFLLIVLLVLPCSVSAANKLSFLTLARQILFCPRPAPPEGFPEDLPSYINPLNLALGATDRYSEYQGALVTVAGFMVLLIAAVVIACVMIRNHATATEGRSGVSEVVHHTNHEELAARRIDPQYVYARGRLGCILLPAAIFYPHALLCSLVILIYATAPWRIVAIAALVLHCLLMLYYTFRIAVDVTRVPRAVLLPNVHRSASQDVAIRWMFGFDEWIPEACTPDSLNWTHLHRLVFEPFHKAGRFHVGIEFVAIGAMGCFAAWPPDTKQDCFVRGAVAAAICFGVAISVLVMSPYLALFDNLTDFVILLVIAGVLGCDLAASMYENPTIHWTAHASVRLIAVALFLIFMKGIIDAFLFHRNGGYSLNLRKYSEIVDDVDTKEDKDAGVGDAGTDGDSRGASGTPSPRRGDVRHGSGSGGGGTDDHSPPAVPAADMRFLDENESAVMHLSIADMGQTGRTAVSAANSSMSPHGWGNVVGGVSPTASPRNNPYLMSARTAVSGASGSHSPSSFNRMTVLDQSHGYGPANQFEKTGDSPVPGAGTARTAPHPLYPPHYGGAPYAGVHGHGSIGPGGYPVLPGSPRSPAMRPSISGSPGRRFGALPIQYASPTGAQFGVLTPESRPATGGVPGSGGVEAAHFSPLPTAAESFDTPPPTNGSGRRKKRTATGGGGGRSVTHGSALLDAHSLPSPHGSGGAERRGRAGAMTRMGSLPPNTSEIAV